VEKLQVMRPGETVAVGGYAFTFRGVVAAQGPNYKARRGTFEVRRGDDLVAVLQPEARAYATSPQETTEAAIRPTLWANLYAVVGDSDGRGGYATRLYLKPLVDWIWLGSLIMTLGGLVSLSDRRLRVGAPAGRRQRRQAAEA
jgi:cytochrome c-type biogenesis protein CcmF